MEAWLIYLKNAAEYNRKYIEFYIEEGAKLDVKVDLILVEDLEFGVRDNKWFVKYKNQEAKHPDFVIFRAIYPLLSRQLELMGIRVFNNSTVADICNDKAKTYQYLAKTGIRMVDTDFYKNVQVKTILEKDDSLTVIKAVDGHGGNQVFLLGTNSHSDIRNGNNTCSYEAAPVETSNQTEVTQQLNHRTASDTTGSTTKQDILKGLGSSDVVVQPLIGSRHQDLRVYVIGKEIIASVLRTAKEGFKSNYSLGGRVCLYELSEKERGIVYMIINQFNFGLVGIDFIIGDEGELIFNEIEDVVGARMLYQCSDINIVKLYLKYIIGEIINEPIKTKEFADRG